MNGKIKNRRLVGRTNACLICQSTCLAPQSSVASNTNVYDKFICHRFSILKYATLTTMEQSRATLLPPPIPFFCICILLFFCHAVAGSSSTSSYAGTEKQAKVTGVVGYGYTISSVNNDLSGKSLTANLNLIKSSPVYGPDIPRLNLAAR